MLVVKVEVWPGGNGNRAFEISRIGIANESMLATYSDYSVTALLSRDREERVVKFDVENHNRGYGWVPLVQGTLTGLATRSAPAPYDDPIARILRKGKYV